MQDKWIPDWEYVLFPWDHAFITFHFLNLSVSCFSVSCYPELRKASTLWTLLVACLLYIFSLLHSEAYCYFLSFCVFYFSVCTSKRSSMFSFWNERLQQISCMKHLHSEKWNRPFQLSLFHGNISVAFPSCKQKKSLKEWEISCLRDVFCMKGRKSAFTEINLLCWEYWKLYGVKLSLAFRGEIRSKIHVIASVLILRTARYPH